MRRKRVDTFFLDVARNIGQNVVREQVCHRVCLRRRGIPRYVV